MTNWAVLRHRPVCFEQQNAFVFVPCLALMELFRLSN